MKCALVGSRFFGAAVFEALRKEEGVEFTRIVVPAADDRLALAAQAAGLAFQVLDNPKVVPAEAIAEGTIRVGQDLPVTVVPMRTTGSQPPLFCVSATEGRVEFFGLAAQIDADVPMYTLSPPRHDEQGRTIRTVEGYAAALREHKEVA